jgi:hypothetical protein
MAATPSDRRALTTVDRVLYPLTVVYTLVLLGFQVYEFWKGGVYQPRVPFAQVYLALLTAYAAQREGAKWLGDSEAATRLRRGELFVALWFATWLAMASLCNLSGRFVLPKELNVITLGVLAVFAGTGVSAAARQARGKGKAVETADRRQKLLQLLKDRGPLTSEEAAPALGVSQSTAWRLLEGLEKEGRVRQTAANSPHGRRYELA